MAETPMSDTRPTIVLDWDGTLVKSAWPAQTREWMPGAVEAVKRLHATGRFQFVVFSARLNPHEYQTGYTVLRDPASVAADTHYIRDMLDWAGLTFVDIYTKPGKPSGEVYVDDKAERYNGHAKSWAKLADKIMLRFNQEVALDTDD